MKAVMTHEFADYKLVYIRKLLIVASFTSCNLWILKNRLQTILLILTV